MNNPYDLPSSNKQYRQEALHEVRMKQLEGLLRENHKVRSVRHPVSLALTNVLSLVRGM
jgi:hypothetical protein